MDIKPLFLPDLSRPLPHDCQYEKHPFGSLFYPPARMFHDLMLVVKYQYARTSQESAVFEMRHIGGVMGWVI